jgi:hypothetical protein
MSIFKILHQCTAGIYRNFFNQSSSQQILRLSLPLIALGAIALALFVRWRWTATTDPIHKNLETIDINNLKNQKAQNTKSETLDERQNTNEDKKDKVTSTQSKTDSSRIRTFDNFRSTKEEYVLDLDPISCKAADIRTTTSDLVDADNFFDQACDSNGDIRLWNTDEPQKMQKTGFMDLARRWVNRGGKFIWPEAHKSVVVDSNTLCLPWCHEGKNRSALVYDYLMRAGHHETLLPEGAKDGYLFPFLEDLNDAEDGRYPVIQTTTGFRNGKVFRIGDKLLAEGTNLKQGFTDLFNQLARLNRPVMIFAFVSAVPILMREILNRTEGGNIKDITIVAFHHDDPMAVLDPRKKGQANAQESWVVNNQLQDQLTQAQTLYTEWDTGSKENLALRNAGKDENDPDRISLVAHCKKLSEQMKPLEANLLFHRRRNAVNEFQHEILARLISVK